MKIVTLLIVSSILFAACNNKPAGKTEKPKEDTAKAPVTEDTAKVPIVGADKDEHGCIGSAGYTWSVVKNECIRIFEAGIRLSAGDAVADKTTDVFIVFGKTNIQAELYLPGQIASSLIMEYGKKNSEMWTNGDWQLNKTDKGYVLKKAGVVQYAE